MNKKSALGADRGCRAFEQAKRGQIDFPWRSALEYMVQNLEHYQSEGKFGLASAYEHDVLRLYRLP